MSEFKISAPSKITLFGEHAQFIKNNKTIVLAGSMDLRTTLKFTELPDSQNVIKIEFPRENLSVDISLEKVLSHFGGDDEFDRLRMKVDSFVLSELKEIRMTKIRAMNLKIVLFLLISISQREQIDIKSFQIHVNSVLPTMSNETLGNTMSSTVCLATCFLHWSRLQKNICNTEFDKDHLEKISKYAMECKDFIYPDYIMPELDASVCTYGSIVELRPERPVNVFGNIPSIKILFVDTKNRDTISTEKENLQRDYPVVVNSIATSIETLTESVCQILRNFSSDNTDESEYNKSLLNLYNNLGLYMTTNQNLIHTLGVPNVNLDRMSYVLMPQHSLTFATIGDCDRYAYTLLKPNITGQDIEDISEKISNLSYIVTIVNLSCEGVRIEECI